MVGPERHQPGADASRVERSGPHHGCECFDSGDYGLAPVLYPRINQGDAIKEDVLEQIVDDYLQLNGYFTIHNVRFKPSKEHPEYSAGDDRVASDVDIVGFNPRRTGPDAVWVVSCKSWQSGFRAEHILKQLKGEAPQPKRQMWRYYRELWVPKWAEALRYEVETRTGSKEFKYSIAVTRLIGDGQGWAEDPTIRSNLRGNPFSFLTLGTMWSEYLEAVGTTPQPSEIGRLAQLLKAARIQ